MKKVLLLLAEGFEIYEASVFIDIMGWNIVDGDGSTKLFSCGFSKEIKKQKKLIASICVAALPLGKSGILKGKKGTTYAMNPVRQNALKEFGVNVVNEPIVIDDNIITSWNPSTAIDVALIVLERLTSKKNSDHIREIMGFAR